MSIGCVEGNSISAGSMTAPSGFDGSRRLMMILLSEETLALKSQGATAGHGHEAHRSTSSRPGPVPNVLLAGSLLGPKTLMADTEVDDRGWMRSVRRK